MKKKILSICMAALVMLATATVSVVPAQAKPVQVATGNTVIRVAKWGDPSTLKSDADKKILDEFNATNKLGITAQLEIIPGDGYGTKLTTSFAGGTIYDVFLSGEGDFYKWVAQGVNQPLDEFIKKDTTFNSKDYSRAVYQMGNINGKQYYLIKDYNPVVLFYNKKMFDAAKLAYPDKNTTWDQLFEMAKKLTKRDNRGRVTAYGFNATSWTYPIYAYLLSNGVDVADSTGTKVDGYINSPEMVYQLDRWFNLSKDEANKVSPTSSNLDSFGGQEAMMINGRLAMFLSGYWSSSSLTDAKASYGTTILPKDNKGNRASILMAAGYCMSNKTKNPEAAYQVIQALTNVKAQEIRTKDTSGVLPTVQSMLNQKLETIPPKDKGVVEVIQYGKQPIGLRSALGNTIDKEFNNAVQKIVQKVDKTQNIMNEAVKEINKAK